MEREQQVTSQEISQRLKELGVRQEYQKGDWCYEASGERLLLIIRTREDNVDVVFPFAEYPNDETLAMKHSLVKAFTVGELGEMYGDVSQKLPHGREIYLSAKYDGKWRTGVSPKTVFEADTEANARGLMLMYLLENKLIKI